MWPPSSFLPTTITSDLLLLLPIISPGSMSDQYWYLQCVKKTKKRPVKSYIFMQFLRILISVIFKKKKKKDFFKNMMKNRCPQFCQYAFRDTFQNVTILTWCILGALDQMCRVLQCTQAKHCFSVMAKPPLKKQMYFGKYMAGWMVAW